MRVLRSFGMKDKRNDPTMIDWDAFRAFSPLLERKSDEEMQEHLYCILAMCTKVIIVFYAVLIYFFFF